MQILLSCAKDMASTVCTYKEIKGSTPLFEQQARELAASMSNYSWEELGQILQINDKLAHLNRLRYLNFLQPDEKSHAVLAFTGMAYRHLKATDFDRTEADFAQQHLWITSFLYGILRPLDEIKNHRLEGYVRLPENDDRSLFDYWKPLLTEKFIASVKKDGGVLLYLASEEMKGLFDWKRVKQEVQVVEPQFMVRKGSGYKTIVVYTKMCRGAMARYVITRRLSNVDDLLGFEYEGYRYQMDISTPQRPIFILD